MPNSGKNNTTVKFNSHFNSILTFIISITIIILLDYFFADFCLGKLQNYKSFYLLTILFCAMEFGFAPSLITLLITLSAYNISIYIENIHLPTSMVQIFKNEIPFLLSSLIAVILGETYYRQASNAEKSKFLVSAIKQLVDNLATVTDIDTAKKVIQTELTAILDTKVYIIDNHALNTKEIASLIEAKFNTTLDKAFLKKLDQLIAGKRLFFKHENHYSSLKLLKTESNNTIGFLVIESDKKKFNDNQNKLIRELEKVSLKELERIILTLEQGDLKVKKALEAERRQLFDVMEKEREEKLKEQRRSAFLSAISHDLKTPLASIIGALSAVRYLGAALNPNSRDTLIKTAQEEAERLNYFITNLLDLTKMESGELKINLEWHDPYDLLAKVIKRMNFRLTRHKIIYEKQDNILFCIDAVLFEQVLQNLIENALKFSPFGTEITIKLWRDNDNKGHLMVIDQGPGIPLEKRADIFDKFNTLDIGNSTTHSTGLGLAIVKAIIETHQGSILIEDNPNPLSETQPGTVFHLIFPKAKRDDQNVC